MIGLISASAWAQQRGEIVEIGQATTTTTLSPIYTPMNYSYSQQLYTAEEIGASGTINSIAFHWAFNGAKTFGIDVYMKHTERSYFETSGDRISMSATDKVFTGTINPDHDAWITITLDTPFEYDGSSNLAIAVHRTSGSSGFNDLDANWNVMGTWYYTNTDRYMMLYMGDDQSQYVSLSPAYMTPSNYRPNIQIELASAVATCKAPKNFAASDITTNSATLTWTAGSDDQSNWDVYLTQSSTDVPNENTSPTYQVSECSKALTGLTAQTTYYAYVRCVCGSDDKSRWVSTNFTTTRDAYHVGANNPYETDFESSCDWAFTNGTLTNQWCWGNATNNGGQKAMYISNNNGTSNAYTTNSAAVVYASKLFTFDQGSYTFVFDWKAKGESTYDYIRVALVPGDAEFTAGTSTPTVPSGYFYNNLPTGWIALDGGGKLNLKDSWQTQTAEIAVSGTYTMVFVWRDDTSGGDNPPAAIDNISISMLSCSKPTNLTANPNSIGSRTATLTWTAGGSETLWDIYLSTASTAPNAQTVPTESNLGSTSHTFNNLQPATIYYAWVRSNCGGGDVSSWSDVYSFSTSCDAYAIPQLFGFEEEAIMNCFTMRSCANSTGRLNQNARTGNYCFRFYYNSNPPQYLISPELTGTENGVHVEFYYKKYSSGTEKFKVGYSTTDDANTSFTWGEEITNATTTYQLFSADYPAGTKFIGIQYTANNQWYLYIDDLSITGPSACPAPTSFTASNVVATTATLSWTENGNATNWVLQYGTDANFATYTEKTSGFSTQGNNISYGLTGLTPETHYYARVKSVNGSDESVWASCDFTTTATCAAPTGLSASKTGSTITLSWTAGAAGQDAWDIRYKKSTDSEYTFIHLDNHASTTYTITGLTPVTTYKVNVRAWCDENDQSKWGAGTNQTYDLSVTTDCGAIDLPYTCDFEGTMQTVNSCKIPSCWSVIKGYHNSTYSYGIPTVADQSSSTQPIAVPHGGTYCLYFLNSTYYETAEEYAILPEISDAYNMKDVQFKFWVRSDNVECPMEVGIMTDPSNANTYVKIEDVNITPTYSEQTVTFNNYSGNGRYIALKCSAPSLYSQKFYVDDITVDYVPSCTLSLPYSYDFESDLDDTSFPMPLCWHRNSITIQHDTYPYVFESTLGDKKPYAHGEGSNSTIGHCLRFYKTSTTSTETAVLPAIEDGYDMNQLQIRFWARLYSETYAGKTLDIGIMTSPTATGTFQAISTITVGGDASNAHTDYEEFVVPFTNYTGNGRYIAIRTGSTMGSNVVQMLVDDITVEEIPNSTTTQTTQLAQGWNWFSTYIEMDDIDGLDMLKESLDDNGLQIKSRNEGYTDYDDGEWFGDLDDVAMTNEQMYMILTSAACSVELQGNVAHPEDHTITINPGWNWIGFPCDQEMSVEDALSEFEPEEEDQIKSFNHYTDFDSGEWFGELEAMTPGLGFMYYSNSNEPKSLIYQSGSAKSSRAATETIPRHWTPVTIGDMNMTCTSVLVIDGIEQYNPQLEIGVFSNDGVCRGASLPKYRALSDQYIYSITIFGLEGYTYTCKVYDHETEQELSLTFVSNQDDPLVFEANHRYGRPSNPYHITFANAVTSYTKEIIGYGNNDGGYYLIATPIDDVNPAEIDGMIATPAGNYDFYWFDQTQNLEWINYKAGVFNMVSGMGYLYANKNDVTLTFTGTPIDGPTYEVSLVKDDDAEFPGWNLVGNPFAEHTAYIDRDCYVMNPEGRFEIIATNTRSIEPMEGAFVIAAENDEPLVFSTEGSAKGSMITLNLSGPSTSSGTAVIDRAIVRFGAGRQLPKFQLRESSTKVYIPVGNQDYAVVCSEGMGEIPVNFKAENNGSYTLSFDSEEVNFNYLHLIDNMTSVETDLLANPSYSFEARTTDYESRFKLVFATNSIGENAEGDNETFAFFNNGSFVISNEGEATLQVIDVNGHILKSESINGCGNVNVNAAAGVYLFRLVNGDSVKVQKVVVR